LKCPIFSSRSNRDGSRIPHELTIDEIHTIHGLFRDAAVRTLNAGFKLLELHFAHGYLAHSFHSPLSNHRTDEYGGSFDNRIRHSLETVKVVRKVWPDHLIMW